MSATNVFVRGGRLFGGDNIGLSVVLFTLCVLLLVSILPKSQLCLI